ncbi:hypothetical protein PI124_g16015 [Phytophthora idaei]|nr:hypothetical protein PI126_g12491 [Phytophthora idaei]KAG3239036.1 hypothetical protein PI124_g16015 [Phytophthora idaei]
MSKTYYRCVTALAACGLVNKSAGWLPSRAVMNGSGEMNGRQSWTGAWSKITTLTCQLSIASRDFIALQQPRRCSNNLRVTAAFESLGFVIVGCGIGSTFHALYRVARKCFSRAERVLSTL